MVRSNLPTLALALTVFACSGAANEERPPVSTAPSNQGTVAPPSQGVASSSQGTVAPSNPTVAPSPPRTVAPSTPPRFDSKKAWAHLRRQVEIGPRPAGSAALDRTRDYITAQLEAVGIESRLQAFVARTPLGDTSMANIIATIPGRRPERIVLASHFDTKLFKDIRFVGANDGASSTAALLELGRVLEGRQNEFTIELLFLDGEEAVIEWQGTDHTYGSRHYVQSAQSAGELGRIKALVLLDMIGDKSLVIRRDSNSTPWLVDVVWAAAARLGHRNVFSDELTTIEDDHVPFLRAGVPAVDVIDLENPTWHTVNDTLDSVSERSLQIVGDVILAALPDIEARLVR
jgi:hypothetical protein